MKGLATNLFIFAFLTTAGFSSAVVSVQDKINEMQEVITTIKTGLKSKFETVHLFGKNEEKKQGSIIHPISLHSAVLEITDSLTHETSKSSWQAMLRALGGDKEVLKRFSQIRQEFASIEKQIGWGESDGIEDNLELLANANISETWSNAWPKMRTAINRVADLYSWFDRYQRNAAVVNDRTLKDYAEIVHSHEGFTVENAIESLHYLLCEDETSMNLTDCAAADSCPCNGKALVEIGRILSQADDEFVCSLSKSEHQMLYDLYLLTAISDAKAFAMMQFSWILLRLYGKGEFIVQASAARAAYLRRTAEKTEGMKKILSQSSTWIRNCNSTEDDTASPIQFTGLLQGFVINEINLSEDKTCKESCSNYVDNKEKNCEANHACAMMRKCNGRIHNCQFIEADSQICSSSSSDRRYDWIEYKSGRVFGKKTECKNEYQHRVNSWWRWVFWHCSYCMCLCDEPGPNSDRYVSLQPQTAGFTENHLVTGVQFVKIDRVVHIKIQQAEALPQGNVNVSTMKWVEPTSVAPIIIGPHRSFEDGPGYATLRYDERSLDLDDLQAPENHVIVGVRFRKLGGHLNLEIQAAPIDFQTGLIDAEKAVWLGNDNTPASESKPRKKLNLISPGVSTECREPSRSDSQHNEYVEFQPTSLHKDVAQTTVPFLDPAAVSPKAPAWLTGIGIYHRGHPGCGGFVSLRVSTLNYANLMKILPERDLESSDEESGGN